MLGHIFQSSPPLSSYITLYFVIESGAIKSILYSHPFMKMSLRYTSVFVRLFTSVISSIADLIKAF